MWTLLLTKRVPYVFLFGLVIHLGFFWLFAGKAFTEHQATDGGQYMTIADNILQGHGFSLHPSAPFAPDTIRTPVYPYFLAITKNLTGSFYLSIYLSILFAATIPLAGMGIMRLLRPSARLELAAGLLLAIDPHLWFYGMIYGSEAIFLPLAAWGLVLTLSAMQKPKAGRAVLAGLVMGLATLARPIVQFVPLLFLVVAIAEYVRRRAAARELAKTAVVFVFVWGLAVAPWLMRSHALFGVWDFSNVGWFNMYTRVAATSEAIETHRPYTEMRVEYLQRLHEAGYIATSPVEEWDVHGYVFKPIFQKLTIKAIEKYPKGFIISQISSFFTVISQDLTVIYAQGLGLLDFTYPSFSPVVVLTSQGLIAFLRAFALEFSWPLAYAALARVFWILLFAVSLTAPWFAWRFRRELFPATVFLVLYDLGIVALSLNAAAQTDARYRAQFIFVQVPLALLAWALWKYRMQRWGDDPVDVSLPGPPCPVCDCVSLSVVRGNVNGFSISRCGLCGAHATSPCPSPEDLAKVYDRGYFNGEGGFGYADYDADKHAAADSLQGFLDALDHHGAVKGRLLDIGAATGVFLRYAQRRGWQTVGHEISEDAAALARAKGLEMRTGKLVSNHALASYQAVTMLDVIEHVSDPSRLIADASKVLAPGGVLLVNTPDAGSLYARVMGLRWHAFVPPEHLTLLTPQAARLLAERAGLRVLWVGRVRKSFRTSYILQTAARWLGWKRLSLLGTWFDKHPRLNLRLPLDLRDNMVLVAVKP